MNGWESERETENGGKKEESAKRELYEIPINFIAF